MSGLHHNLQTLFSDVYLKQILILQLLYPLLSDVILSLQSIKYLVCLLKSAIIVLTQYFGIFKIAATLSIAHHSITFKR